MTCFLNNYRKETIDAKRHGQLDEEGSNPIPWSLFQLILTWSLSTGNNFFMGVQPTTVELHGTVNQYWGSLPSLLQDWRGQSDLQI
jgi:hypothetical protein